MDKLDGHWAKRSILERDTGKFYNKYFYKRKPAHRVVLDTPKSKKLAGYVLIEKDLRSAIFWLEQVKSLLGIEELDDKNHGYVANTENRDKYNVVKGLFVAALTFYGKSFSTSHGRKVKLERKNLGEEFFELHDHIMELRHDFAAHSGESQIEYVSIVIALDAKKKAPPYLAKELFQPDAIFAKDLEDTFTLFKHAKSLAEDKISVLSKKVYHDDVLPKGSDYWYEKT